MWPHLWFLTPMLRDPGDGPNLTVLMSMLQQSGHVRRL